MNKYDHIIWDWNGTLVDDTWLCVEIMNNELKRIGKDGLTYQQYQRKFTFPVKDFYEEIGFDFSEGSYEDFAKSFIKAYGEKRFNCDLHFGIPELLEKTTKYGIKHSILSAYAQDVLEEAVDHYGIKDHFEVIKGLNDHFAGGKIEEGKDLVGKISENKDRIVLVGDTLHDKEVADAMGIDAILIKNGHQSDVVLKAECPVVSSISEAITHII